MNAPKITREELEKLLEKVRKQIGRGDDVIKLGKHIALIERRPELEEGRER